jgi:hypothetical protein
VGFSSILRTADPNIRPKGEPWLVVATNNSRTKK